MWFRKKRDPIASFWEWFAAHSAELLAMQGPHLPAFNALQERLHAVHPDLVFEFDVQARPKRFIVSADGRRELFPLVVDVVGRAPVLAGWSVVAFRQPGPTDVVIEMGDLRLGANDLWFTSEPHNDRTGIVLFVRGLVPANQDAISRAAYILLDNALGEFLTETAVGFIEFEPLPDRPQESGLRPFAELPQVVVSAPTSSN